jgi:hypothetical protein
VHVHPPQHGQLAQDCRDGTTELILIHRTATAMPQAWLPQRRHGQTTLAKRTYELGLPAIGEPQPRLARGDVKSMPFGRRCAAVVHRRYSQ